MNQNNQTKSKLRFNHYAHLVRLSQRSDCTYIQSYINASGRSYTFVLHGFFVGVSVGLLITGCTAVILPRCCYGVTNEGRIYPLVLKLNLHNT